MGDATDQHDPIQRVRAEDVGVVVGDETSPTQRDELAWARLPWRPMRIDKIAIGDNPPHDINVIIEVPVGGEPIKYELDKESGTLFVDRFLYTPMRYPGNYGFVPHTLSDDGDPIDVLVCNTRKIVPAAVINCRPIGVLVMEDEAGHDEKILAVPSPHVSRRYAEVKEYEQLPEITREQIQHFFQHYKDLEPDKWARIDHWGNATEAQQMILAAIARAAA
jgi:inorganic pyrophosphatase